MAEHILPHDWPPPPRRRVYLMRHGEVDYFDSTGRPHPVHTVPLTSRGAEQARAVGLALAEVPLDLVVSSGLRRTDETAQLVLGSRSVPVETEPRLREIEPGRLADWAAVPPAAVRQFLLGSLGEGLEPTTQFLHGETIGACQERVQQAWHALLQRPGWSTVVVVAHNVVNRLLLGACLGLPLSSLGRIEQDPCGVNLIEVDSVGHTLVRFLNCSIHEPSKHTQRLTALEGLFEQFLRGRS
ncbi:MAG: histidine phosphatase family protein [Gemmataceae bacterium]